MTNLEILRTLAITANNVVLKGHYSGDDIHEASALCKWCEQLIDHIVVLEKSEEKKEDADTKQAE